MILPPFSLLSSYIMFLWIPLVLVTSGEAQEMEPRKFLAALQQVSQLGDLRRYDEVARLFGLTLKLEAMPKGKALQLLRAPSWLFSLEYPLAENLEKQRMNFIIKSDTLCVTQSDILSIFGQDYTRYYGPPPIFSNPEAEREYAKIVQEGSGAYGFSYKTSRTPTVAIGFSFFFQKCLQQCGMEITSTSSKD